MRSIDEIRKRIAEIEADERYISGKEHPAIVDINAPLALIQVAFESEVRTLKWLLQEVKP